MPTMKTPPALSIILLLILGAIFCVAGITYAQHLQQQNSQNGPLAGKTFYRDNNRPISKLLKEYAAKDDYANAELAAVVASQPGSTWLTGPSVEDKTANRDIESTKRTSAEANQRGTVPVYVLYAIPHRDICVGFSQGGFLWQDDYLQWVDQIIGATQTPAIFVVEPDAVAHTVHANCLNEHQKEERYALIRQVVEKLVKSPNALAVYIDSGNAEWFKNPASLVEPLRKSGIGEARGVAINVSSFVATRDSERWAQRLLHGIGGDKGAIIDTSRNGNGSPAADITGTARWCNPPGRAIGNNPTTKTDTEGIDAYFWGKNIGESDGECFGKPAAGTFVPELALQLVKNRPSPKR